MPHCRVARYDYGHVLLTVLDRVLSHAIHYLWHATPAVCSLCRLLTWSEQRRCAARVGWQSAATADEGVTTKCKCQTVSWSLPGHVVNYYNVISACRRHEGVQVAQNYNTVRKRVVNFTLRPLWSRETTQTLIEWEVVGAPEQVWTFLFPDGIRTPDVPVRGQVTVRRELLLLSVVTVRRHHCRTAGCNKTVVGDCQGNRLSLVWLYVTSLMQQLLQMKYYTLLQTDKQTEHHVGSSLRKPG
jgi:hypothetical protein